jgi:hypothetical protein
LVAAGILGNIPLAAKVDLTPAMVPKNKIKLKIDRFFH